MGWMVCGGGEGRVCKWVRVRGESCGWVTRREKRVRRVGMRRRKEEGERKNDGVWRVGGERGTR